MLGDVNVLEFGEFVASPAASMLLADLGARVIKIERPDGDPIRHWPSYETWNRNKEICRLDVRSDQGASEALRLIRGTDVVIEGWKPGLLERAGICQQDLTASNPRLIWCSLPPFAPELGVKASLGWEPLIGAMTGAHGNRRGPRTPAFTPLPFASMFAGLLAATSVTAALIARERTGRGQSIQVPIHSAAFFPMGFNLLRVGGAGVLRAGPGAAQTSSIVPLVAPYRCSDGRWIFFNNATPRMQRALIGGLNLHSWAEEGLLNPERRPTDANMTQALHERLSSLFATKTALEWETKLSDLGLSCTICRTVEEWLHHPQARTAGQVVELASRFGPMLQPGNLIQLPDGPPLPAPEPAVRRQQVAWGGELEWERAAPKSSDSGAATGALEGLKVVDLTIYIAGPSCGRTLAEFGADVIKVDAPAIGVTEQFWRDTSRGKRSIALDAKHPKGREILLRLLDSADVVVENFRKGVADRLGISYEQVAARNPGIIYASLNCYGYSGPFASRPGWEQLGQAVSGMQVRAGGRDGVPALARYAVTDYGTGLSLALGVLAALHERQKTGQGQHISAALAAVAGYLQSVYMFDYPGYERREIEGQEATGLSPLSRLYECGDGWIYLHCLPSQWDDLVSVLDLRDLDAEASAQAKSAPNSPLADRIAERLRTKPAGVWLDALQERGLAAVRAASMEDLQTDPAVRKAGLIEVSDVEGESIEHVGIPHRLSMTPATSRWEAPAFGADTVAILKELGYQDEDVGELFRQNVVMT